MENELEEIFRGFEERFLQRLEEFEARLLRMFSELSESSDKL
jgi:hypothetical protein